MKLFLGPLASELKTKMVEDQHKLNGAAEEEKEEEKEEEEEVMNNEAATRRIIVASEAAHQIESLTILAAVEPASSSTTTTTTTTTQVVQITPASPNPKATTTPRAKVPLEKGYSQMVWLKLLRTEPDLAGSLSPLSPLSLNCNFLLSFTLSHNIEVCS